MAPVAQGALIPSVDLDQGLGVDGWDVEALVRALYGAGAVTFAATARRDRARLVQGHQEDLDLFLADTLGRAAAAAGLGHICADGATPEVERALGAYGVPVRPGETSLQFTDSSGPGVRSVQRLPRPTDSRAEQVATHYLRTVPRLIGFGSRQEGAVWHLGPFLSLRWSELSTPDRVVLPVTGGVLAGGSGRLEFREVLGGEAILAAVVDFEPALPWPLYRVSQAPAHVLAMRLFGRAIRGRSEL